MNSERQIKIDADLTGRIDKVLGHFLSDVSRSQLQKWIEDGHVTVNGQSVKTKYKLQVGDMVRIIPEEPQTIDLEPENIPLDIVYEDDDVIVVNKPAGMVVHPAPGHPGHTLVNALLYHSPLSTINGEFRPGIVHRIDKDTSGLLMVAKNDLAHRSLAAQLKSKTNQREYVALVHGVIKEEQGTIDAPLGRSKKDRKKQAVTIRWSNVGWRLDERIRFAFIWPISGIPWLAIHCMGHAKPWLDRDSICMLVCWAFDTPAAVKRWCLPRRCQTTLPRCLNIWTKPTAVMNSFEAA